MWIRLSLLNLCFRCDSTDICTSGRAAPFQQPKVVAAIHINDQRHHDFRLRTDRLVAVRSLRHVVRTVTAGRPVAADQLTVNIEPRRRSRNTATEMEAFAEMFAEIGSDDRKSGKKQSIRRFVLISRHQFFHVDDAVLVAEVADRLVGLLFDGPQSVDDSV